MKHVIFDSFRTPHQSCKGEVHRGGQTAKLKKGKKP